MTDSFVRDFLLEGDSPAGTLVCPKATFWYEWLPPIRQIWFPFRPVLTQV